MTDGIGGTDGSNNIEVLFPDKPSAAPSGPQSDVIELLEEVLAEARAGKCVGLLLLGFDDFGGNRSNMKGKLSFSNCIAALDRVKFGILARDYAENLQTAQQTK